MMRTSKRLLISVVAAACAASETVAQSAEFYVSPTGRNSNRGTRQSPFLTLNYAMSRLKAGDTLWVTGGVYDESLIYNVPSGTSWTNKVRIAAYDDEVVTMRPSAGLSVLRFAGSSKEGGVGEQKYIEFDGIDFDGTNVRYDVIKIEAGPGYNAHHIRIKNSLITMLSRPDGAAVLMTGLRPDAIGFNEFQHVTVTGGGPVVPPNDFATMFYVQTPDNLIEHCLIYGGIGAGIQVYNQNSPGSWPSRTVIRNNVIRDFTTSTWSRLYGIIVATGIKSQIYNNRIYNIAGTGGNSGGIYVYGGADAEVNNNTVYGNALFGILVESFATGTVLRNNTTYENGRSDYLDRGLKTVASGNLIGVKPDAARPADEPVAGRRSRLVRP